MKPKVKIIVLGGTITMAPQPSGGIVPSLTGADLVAAVPELAAIAEIEVVTPFLVPGPSLTFAQMRAVAGEAAQALRSGAAGIVIAQGTDTIDETSFLLDLCHDGPEPLIVTGAMRGAKAPGADGHANLLSAVIVAAAPQAQGLGVLVVLNDEIHAARAVEKLHTALPSAFASPGSGPLGHVVEGEVRIATRPTRIAGPASIEMLGEPAPVAIVKATLGDDDRMIGAIAGLGYRGLVVEGMGAGHLPQTLVPALERLARQIPVVLATRVPGGPIFRRTYGFPGSEMDLIGRGLIPAGTLSAHKARLLLAVLLGAGRSAAEIGEAFDAFR